MVSSERASSSSGAQYAPSPRSGSVTTLEKGAFTHDKYGISCYFLGGNGSQT